MFDADYECDGQISMFNSLPVSMKPGDWIEEEHVGRELTFDEIADMVGKLIVFDYSTESHKWYKVVQAERISTDERGRRTLILYDGMKQRGTVDEMYFDKKIRFPARAYELKD